MLMIRALIGPRFSIMGQFREYLCPIGLTDYPPAKGFLGKIPCRWTERVNGQVVRHLPEGRVQRIFATSEGSDVIYQAPLFINIIKWTRLSQNPSL